jgi:hypothetical protein
MEGRLTPLGLILKWVVVPVAIALIGYLLIGPNLGKDVLKRLPGMGSNKPAGPSVEVDVKPSGRN